MSGASSIEWCDAVWNPTRGCSVISPGCVNCYAMKQAHRFSGPGKAFEGYTKATKSGPQWTGKVSLVESALDWPLRYRGHKDAIAEGRPTRIFVNSMSDLFHESLSDEDIDKVFARIILCDGTTGRHHTFQILTKRSERMRAYMTDADTPERVAAEICAHLFNGYYPRRGSHDWHAITPWPPSNAHLGVSAENQEQADKRIPDLLATPAAVRFVSAEPLLGPIDFSWNGTTSRGLPIYWEGTHADGPLPNYCGLSGNFLGTTPRRGWAPYSGKGIDWLILGGESGAKARPCDVSWIRSIKNQCQSAGVPVFVKQFGSRPHDRDSEGFGNYRGSLRPLHLIDRKGGDPEEWPKDLRVREFPKGVR